MGSRLNRLRLRLRKLESIDQDKAAKSTGLGAKETEREQENGPPRREESWAPDEWGQRVLEGLRRLWRQECIDAFGVHSNASGDLDVWTRV